MDLRARMQDGVVLWWIWIWFRIAVDLSLVVNNGFVRVSAKCVVFVSYLQSVSYLCGRDGQ